MQPGFPVSQWESRASPGVIPLEEDSPELPQEQALQSRAGDLLHTNGKNTEHQAPGFTFPLKEPALIAYCSSSPSLLFLCGLVWRGHSGGSGAAGVHWRSRLHRDKQTSYSYRFYLMSGNKAFLCLFFTFTLYSPALVMDVRSSRAGAVI